MAVSSKTVSGPRAPAAPSRPTATLIPGVRIRTKRSRLWVAAAVTAVLAGGLFNVVLFASAGHPNSVFVVARPIARGTTLTAQDLKTLALVAGQQTASLAADRPDFVIGKVATVDLPAGSLITTSSIATSLPVPDGKALVGLSLKPAQLPASPVVAGDHITIVPIVDGVAGSVDHSAGSVPTDSVSAVVSDTSANAQTGTTIVDVYVEETVAADLTSRAASGAVAIYLTSSNPSTGR